MNFLRRSVSTSLRSTSSFHQARFHSFGKPLSNGTDAFPLTGVDYVEVYTSNAKQAAHYYETVMGFKPVAYSGLETGNADKTSYVLQQGNIRLVLTAPMRAGSDVGAMVSEHGDFVRNVGLSCPDISKAHSELTKRGADIVSPPKSHKDADGEVSDMSIQVYGNTLKSFVDRSKYQGVFAPGFTPIESRVGLEVLKKDVGLKYIDHMVANVGWGEMDPWCKWYEEKLGFTQLISFDDNDISTEYTALKSKVMTNRDGTCKFPINEPAVGKKKSQIEEYLDFNNAPGIQHIAVATDDIIRTVSELRLRGCEFLTIPDTYYEQLKDRIGADVIQEDIEVLKKLNILVDQDDEGYMLQIFTKPVLDRPTLFFEIIQRHGAQSFGKGNFKALFVSIEEEQKKRNTL